MMLPILAFVFGSLIIAAAAIAFMPGRAVAIERRLEELTSAREDGPENRRTYQALMGLVKRVGERAPKNVKELSSLRQRLMQAGFRRPEAMTVFFGVRIMFALGIFFLMSTSIIARPNVTMALAGLALGYVAPGMVLARLAKRRSHRIRLSLADALDLLVVSVEAGLGLDQALTRVGSELSFAYPDLADELRLVNLELRACLLYTSPSPRDS